MAKDTDHDEQVRRDEQSRQQTQRGVEDKQKGYGNYSPPKTGVFPSDDLAAKKAYDEAWRQTPYPKNTH